MAQLLPNGRQQFLDANGNPLVGGLVYFYIPNTTTPKDTWQDAAKSALNTNPVVCDARGQATIYGEGDYRQILQDAAGNQIWDKTVAANSFQSYDQGSEPTTDQGDIWINGIGPCRWDADDSKYYRIPFWNNRVEMAASDAVVLDDFTNQVRVTAAAAGGGGGSGGPAGGSSARSTGGGGGGAGDCVVKKVYSVVPGSTLNAIVGARGTGGASSSTSSFPGTDGGNTTISGLDGDTVTLVGGKGGGGGVTGAPGSITGGAGGGAGGGQATGGADSADIWGSASAGALGAQGGGSLLGEGGLGGRGAANNALPGRSSNAPGAGGGGGGGAYNSGGVNDHFSGGAGGDGSDGILIVEY